MRSLRVSISLVLIAIVVALAAAEAYVKIFDPLAIQARPNAREQASLDVHSAIDAALADAGTSKVVKDALAAIKKVLG